VWVLIFSTTFVWNISHSNKNWARYDQKCILVFMWSTGFSFQILMKLQFSRQNFEKHSYQISWKSIQLMPSCLWGRADRQYDASIRFMQYCERA
jgi:hypothetical protein